MTQKIEYQSAPATGNEDKDELVFIDRSNGFILSSYEVSLKFNQPHSEGQFIPVKVTNVTEQKDEHIEALRYSLSEMIYLAKQVMNLDAEETSRIQRAELIYGAKCKL